ncbi:calcium-binding protein [Sphingomonadaceae bacterium G21617-S1]|nr:calcium-binding protein [Sphingomonadaceae bacterium G21617-S1]
MATFVFENMTQAQADALVATDVIAFATTTVTARNIGVANSTQLGTDTITLTAGAKSLNFNATTLSALSDANRIAFNDNSSLVLGTQAADAALTGATNPNTVYLFAGNDSITQAGVDTEDFIYGMGGNDTIVGGSTASHLYGFNASGGTDGTDSITGGAAGDYIQGNAGNDTLAGGNGSDRLLGGAGNDTISGGADQDTVNGNTGNDTIDGGTENDFLRGGQGNDDVRGGANADTILGDLGTDTLVGGTGVDLVAGGAGNDVFVFGSTTTSVTDAAPVTPAGTTVAQYETVADFTNGEDTFQIRGSTTSAVAFGTAAADVVRGSSDAVFNTVSAATTYAQQLLDANASLVDVAAVKVGSDVYLFWASDASAGALVDNIVKLQGVSDVSLITGGASGDFV